MKEISEYRFSRNGEEPVTVRGVPGLEGYIEVTTEYALDLLRRAGSDGVVAESAPGRVMFTVSALSELMAIDGWAPARSIPDPARVSGPNENGDARDE